MTAGGWQEVGPGVLVRRHQELDLNCGLVVGQERALVIDTRATTRQGEALAAAVREVTSLEQVVVNTHAHHDHCFGNAAFRDSQVYAHAGAADDLLRTAEHQRAQVMQALRAAGRQDELADVAATEVVLPFYLVEQDTPLDLGGRQVHLLHGGRGHTDHDLVVADPGGGVVFWGDLVEEGADPAMEDSYPLEWAATVARLRQHPQVRDCPMGVPGHGAVVDTDFVDEQCQVLHRLAAQLAEAVAEGEGDVARLVQRCQGLGLQLDTVRTTAVRVLETRGSGPGPGPG
ncbi:MBL fold metallo-hydrolase [Ornithinicoccus halotolerans]|uniref:MBL fold metallo-hydrolase n=1 Tax=Ornithinicoccus halotolerans TaxID=1748220 RepID=UPI00129587A5|nr:MBL fold metallo-hydrolase [Ornithinicoccus halotolerans]